MPLAGRRSATQRSANIGFTSKSARLEILSAQSPSGLIVVVEMWAVRRAGVWAGGRMGARAGRRAGGWVTSIAFERKVRDELRVKTYLERN